MLLSIFIPTYKRSHAVKRVLGELSFILRDYRFLNVELVISDNASGCDYSFMSKYKSARIILHIAEKNTGLKGNILRASHLCSGRYILILSDEDVIKSESLACLVKYLGKSDTYANALMLLGVTTQEGVIIPGRAMSGFVNVGSLDWYSAGYISGAVISKEQLSSGLNYVDFMNPANMYPTLTLMCISGFSYISTLGAIHIQMVQDLPSAIHEELTNAKSHLYIDNKIRYIGFLVSCMSWYLLNHKILDLSKKAEYVMQWSLLLKRMYKEAFKPIHADKADEGILLDFHGKTAISTPGTQ